MYPKIYIKGYGQHLDTIMQSISVNEANHMLKKIDEQRYKVISTILDQEFSELEGKKKLDIQEVDDLYNQKEWLDWISKYGNDIQKDFKKPTTKLLNGLIDRISVSSVMWRLGMGRKLKEDIYSISNSNY